MLRMFPRAFSLFFLSLLPLSISSFHLSLSFYALKFVSAQRFSASLTAAALASQASLGALPPLFPLQKFVLAQRFISSFRCRALPRKPPIAPFLSSFLIKNLFQLSALAPLYPACSLLHLFL